MLKTITEQVTNSTATEQEQKLLPDIKDKLHKGLGCFSVLQ